MSFAHNHGLKGHMSAVHEKKKPHLCPTCGVSFADKGNLTKHIAAVHKGIKRDQWKTGKNKLSLIANQWLGRRFKSFLLIDVKLK